MRSTGALRRFRPSSLVRWARGGWMRMGAIVVVVVLVFAGSAVGFQRWRVANYKDLEFIGFDKDRVLSIESKLTSWPTRAVGSPYEAQAAEYIRSQFEAAGLKGVTIEEYDEVEYEVRGASLELVYYVNGPLKKVPDPRRDPVTFTNKVDFVVQGYSGSIKQGSGATGFLSDLEYVKIDGNGTEASMYATAAGKVAIIDTDPTASNRAIYDVAFKAGVAAIILHNVNIHENIGFVPISKGNRQPDGWPDPNYPTIPFIMVSRDCGDKILATNSGKLRMDVDVDIGVRKVHVVTGELRGTKAPDEFIVIGGHHDSVYNGVGAVDDGSGATTVVELAYELAKRKVDRSIRFITFGGEEDGLYGSRDYTAAHKDELVKDCKGMLNFDMPHVNLQRGNQGWLTPDNKDRFGVMKAILEDVYKARPDLRTRFNYTVEWEEHPGEVGSDSNPFAQLGIETSNCWGSGSWEYHTYIDDMDHFMPEGLEMAVLIGGSYALYRADH